MRIEELILEGISSYYEAITLLISIQASSRTLNGRKLVDGTRLSTQLLASMAPANLIFLTRYALSLVSLICLWYVDLDVQDH